MNKFRTVALMLCGTGEEPEYLRNQLTDGEYKAICTAYASLKQQFVLTDISELLCAADIKALVSDAQIKVVTETLEVRPQPVWLDRLAENATPHAHQVFLAIIKSEPTLG